MKRTVAAAAWVVLLLSGCEEPTGTEPPDPVEPPGPGGFTLDQERVVGFPALQERVGKEEAARVTAMHDRGGTGKGQLVGTIESGANLEHPDLKGQFAHTCAMGQCNDGRPNRDDHSPLLDTDDHGTLVNGIIAARKDGSGVYGVAYEARIASYGNTAYTLYPWGNDCGGVPNCPPGLRDKRHQWSELFDQEIARGIDWMRSLDVGVTNFSWGRTYEWSREKETRYGITAATVRAIMPVTLQAFTAYADAGGVAVWAAGNGDSLHPAVEGMVPRYFPELEKAWLTVVGIGTDGRIGVFSHYCGDAADWCLAAPGEVVTTHRGGSWIHAGGTSMAAPYVAAAIAALKNRFPDMSYQQLRAHLLATADKSPPYDDEAVYGQGRLDLDATSRTPVGER